jgi:hypothetical protein
VRAPNLESSESSRETAGLFGIFEKTRGKPHVGIIKAAAEMTAGQAVALIAIPDRSDEPPETSTAESEFMTSWSLPGQLKAFCLGRLRKLPGSITVRGAGLPILRRESIFPLLNP